MRSPHNRKAPIPLLLLLAAATPSYAITITGPPHPPGLEDMSQDFQDGYDFGYQDGYDKAAETLAPDPPEPSTQHSQVAFAGGAQGAMAFMALLVLMTLSGIFGSFLLATPPRTAP